MQNCQLSIHIFQLTTLCKSIILFINEHCTVQKVHKPSIPRGGCRSPPVFSQWPIGWRSPESTSLQKSFLSSLPSSRSPSRGPWRLMTVAMHVDVRFRGSDASSFMPTLNSFGGGTDAYSSIFNPFIGIIIIIIIIIIQKSTLQTKKKLRRNKPFREFTLLTQWLKGLFYSNKQEHHFPIAFSIMHKKTEWYRRRPMWLIDLFGVVEFLAKYAVFQSCKTLFCEELQQIMKEFLNFSSSQYT